MPYTYDYPMFSLTTDVIVYDSRDDTIALITRGGEPYKNHYALPGGYVEINEHAANAATREMEEEIGIQLNTQDLTQLHTFSCVNRDPRGRVVSIVYYVDLALTRYTMDDLKHGDDAAAIHVVQLDDVLDLDLAFDHFSIIKMFIDMYN